MLSRRAARSQQRGVQQSPQAARPVASVKCFSASFRRELSLPWICLRQKIPSECAQTEHKERKGHEKNRREGKTLRVACLPQATAHAAKCRRPCPTTSSCRTSRRHCGHYPRQHSTVINLVGAKQICRSTAAHRRKKCGLCLGQYSRFVNLLSAQKICAGDRSGNS